MEITRPSIARLARRAGVKTVADECYPHIRALIAQRLDLVLRHSLVVNSEHTTKTLMANDVYEALALLGDNITRSSDLGTSTVSK